MPKLILLRGNSGSGKTTVAKKLQERFGSNTMLISHDMVRKQILHVWSREGVEKSQPLMIELMKYGKRNSEITIMEGILPLKDYAQLFATAVTEYGDNIYSYYWDIPFEETLRRHRTKPNRNDFGEEDMRNNKPPAMRVESKRYTKNHLSAYNRGVQATIKRKER